MKSIFAICDRCYGRLVNVTGLVLQTQAPMHLVWLPGPCLFCGKLTSNHYQGVLLPQPSVGPSEYKGEGIA